MVPKLRFSRGLIAKVPCAITCTARVRAPRSRSSKFLQAQRPSTEHKKKRWWRWGFFFFTFGVLSSVWFLFYQRFDAALLLFLTADSQCFTRDDGRIFVPTIPRRRRAFTANWNIEVFVHSNSASSVVNFSHQAPPPPVSSTSQSPIVISVALAYFNKTKPALSLIAVVTKVFKRTARTSLCRIWEHPQHCFPPFKQKPREA